jgi:hypothetical protein
MKVKYINLEMASKQALSEILHASLPIAVSLTVIKNVDRISIELENMYKAIRVINEKYNNLNPIIDNDTKTAEQIQIQLDIDKKNQEDRKKEFDELLNIEVDIDLTSIKFSELGKINITPATLKILENVGILNLNE